MNQGLCVCLSVLISFSNLLLKFLAKILSMFIFIQSHGFGTATLVHIFLRAKVHLEFCTLYLFLRKLLANLIDFAHLLSLFNLTKNIQDRYKDYSPLFADPDW